MNNGNIEFFLGIDGGGTKTEFLLTDKGGNEIRRLLLGPSNPVNVGIENTLSLLNSGFAAIIRDFPCEKISVFAGIAGCKSPETQKEITNTLSRYGFGAFSCASDVDNAISTALGRKNGIAVIMGTGIVAYARYNNVLHRVGGWGYMIDKGGSAYCYGADALECALSFSDGRGGSEIIKNLVEKRLSQSVEDAIPQIYKNGPSFVASFAPAVFEAYEMDDKKAEEIIKRNCKQAAEIIIAAGKSIPEERVSTVILGGLCRQSGIIEKYLKEYLDEKYSLSFSQEPMVNGAVLMAMTINEGRIC